VHNCMKLGVTAVQFVVSNCVPRSVDAPGGHDTSGFVFIVIHTPV
jgi:hypothetical protein